MFKGLKRFKRFIKLIWTPSRSIWAYIYITYIYIYLHIFTYIYILTSIHISLDITKIITKNNDIIKNGSVLMGKFFNLCYKYIKNKFVWNISYLKTCGFHLIRGIYLAFHQNIIKIYKTHFTTSENIASCYTDAVGSFILIL